MALAAQNGVYYLPLVTTRWQAEIVTHLSGDKRYKDRDELKGWAQAGQST